MRKKSQMEIFGLAIVIVIITIGFMFYLSSSFGKKNSSSSSYVNVETAQRFIDSVLDAQTECGSSLTDIIKDCAGTNHLCQPVDSCEYARETLVNSFAHTLDIWKKDYRLTVKMGDTNLIEPLVQSCTENMEREAPGIQPIPNIPMIMVRLDICRE